MLDEACEIIDEVTVQGVVHRTKSAKLKDHVMQGLGLRPKGLGFKVRGLGFLG